MSMKWTPVHEEPRVLPEEGLTREVGIRAPSVTHPHREGDVGEGTDSARRLDLLDSAIPRLPPEVLVDHEPDAGVARELHDAAAGLVSGRQWLLTDDVHATLGRVATYLFVRLRRCNDVDEVGCFAVDHLLPVRWPPSPHSPP